MNNEYKQIGSFESEPPEAVAVGNKIIVLKAKNTLEVIEGNSRSKISLNEEIIDIAVAENIIVLTENSVTAYSTGGNPRWSNNHSQGIGVSASYKGSVCGVLTEEELRIFDIHTGNLEATQTRNEKGGDDDILLSTDDSFIYATWSFLTVVDLDGKQQFELDLESVINDIGYFSDRIVVSLQSDKVVALDSADGSIAWRNEFKSAQIPPYGDSEMIISTNNGILSIDPNGAAESVSGITNGDVYMTKKGGVVFAVKNGLVSRHIRENNQFNINLINETVGREGSIEIEITNPTKQPKSTEIELNIENCTLFSKSTSVSLEPDESKTLSFQVEDIEAEKESELNLLVQNTVIYTTEIMLKDTVGGLQAVDATIDVREIKGGEALVEITFENKGELRIDSTQVTEVNAKIENFEPGDSYSEIVSREYEPGRSISVGYKITKGDRQKEYALSTELPEEPSINAEIEEDALKAKIVSSSKIEFVDQLVIELPGAKRVRTDIRIEKGSYDLIVPKYEEGVARIALESLDIEKLIKLTGSEPLVSRKRKSNQNTNSSKQNTVERKQNNSTSQNSSISRNNTENSQSVGVGERVQIERNAPDEVPAPGHVILDKVRISNNGKELTNIQITSNDNDKKIKQIDSSDSVTIERFVSIFDKEKNKLPEINVYNDGKQLASAQPKRIEFSEENLSPRAVFDNVNNEFIAKVNNHDSESYKLESIAFGSNSKKQNIEKDIESDSEVILHFETPEEISNVEDNIPVFLQYEDKNGNEKTMRFLAYTTNSDEISTELTSDEILETKIGSETNVAGEYRSVVIELVNLHGSIIEEITVEASGDAVHDTFYTPAYQDELQPNSEIHHFVDLKSSISSPSLEVDVAFTVDGEEKDFKMRLEGPAIENEDNWKEEHIDQWSINRIDQEIPELPDFPNIVSTRFHESED